MRGFSDDFDRRWKEAEASHRRMRRVIIAIWIVVMLLIVCAIAGGIYALATVGPEDIGTWVGRLMRAFHGVRHDGVPS
jgi:hypothetical protein